MGHVITFMIGRRAPKGEKWAQIRKRDVQVRLHAWKRLVNAIDPNWDANDLPFVNIMPPLATNLPSGVAPEAIKDPKLRAQYEAAIEKNRLKAERYNEQSGLRKWLRRFPPRAERYIVRAYSKPPYNPEELKQYLETYIETQPTKTRILNAVIENMREEVYDVPEKSAVETDVERLLPGSSMSIEDALQTPHLIFVAVCEAADQLYSHEKNEGLIFSNTSYESSPERAVIGTCSQKFRIVKALAGRTPTSGEVFLQYGYLDGPSCFERPVKKGERLIWTVHWRQVGGYTGVKALADTPENRAAVIKLAAPVGRVIRNTWDMAEFFVDALAAGWGDKMQGFYHPEYSMNSVTYPLIDTDKRKLNALGEQLAESNVKIANVCADRWQAVAVTSAVKSDSDEERFLVVRMRNPMFGWKVTSFELKTAEEADSQLKAFLKQYIQARRIDSNGNTIIEWGEPVEGIQCQLRPDKIKWHLGETPTLKADIRNHGKQQL
ncbi:MAG: hypothetical protein ACYS8I_10570, partial [Planctomycetota bacterium]